MTQEQKINYMRIAAGIAGFSLQNVHMDLLVSLYELVLKKEGDANLDEIVDVELQVDARERERQRVEKSETLSKR